MRRISSIIVILFIIPSLLWFFSENFESLTWAYFSIRSFVIQYSGILAISVMSVAMILALRLPSIEKLTQGLDKSYRLHKWLGISGLILAIIHWFWAKGTKYMVGAGLLEKPIRHGKQAGSAVGDGLGVGLADGSGKLLPDYSTIEGVFRNLRHLAESIGEWGFYLFLILITISLLKIITYSKFFNTHKVMSVVYLLFVFHSIVLIKFSYWQTPIGWFTGLLMFAGSCAAVYSLCGQIGKKNRVSGSVDKFKFYKDNRILDITINTKKAWRGHQPGQFAFVKFKGEEAHPFTIGSVDKQTGQVQFRIKGIGDFTNKLIHNIKINDQVIIEGPYGSFNFQSQTQHQIWVAGGIGIAAFTAQMEYLVENKDHKKIDLFYCTQCPDLDFIAYIKSLAEQSNINLHVIDTNVDGFLTAQEICDSVNGWQKSDIWFCGPSKFANTLKNRFAKLGLKANNFHNELFEMR